METNCDQPPWRDREWRDDLLGWGRNATNIGLLIVSSYPNCQGYKIETTGPTERKGVEVSGLWMVAEKWEEETGGLS